MRLDPLCPYRLLPDDPLAQWVRSALDLVPVPWPLPRQELVVLPPNLHLLLWLLPLVDCWLLQLVNSLDSLPASWHRAHRYWLQLVNPRDLLPASWHRAHR